MKRILAATALLTLALVGAFFAAFMRDRAALPAHPLAAPSDAAAPRAESPSSPESDASAPLVSASPPVDRRSEADPARPAPVALQDSRLLSGTIIAIDELGAEHPAEDGRFSLVLQSKDFGEFHEIDVEKGSWSTELPADPVIVALSFAGAQLGNRQAVFEQSIDERIDLPADGHLALRVHWVPDTWLHVRARESGLELAPVLVAEVLEWPESEYAHPGAAGASARDLGPSPVRVPLATASYVLGVRTLHVRSPGYAWGRIQVDTKAAGERVLMLERSGELDVQVLGTAGDPAARLRFRGADPQPLLDLAFPGESALTFDGFAAGPIGLRAEIGDWWDQPIVLGQADAAIVAGERTSVTLRVEPVAAGTKVPFAGELSVPAAWDLADFQLEFFFLDTALGGEAGRFSIPRSSMQPVGETGELFHWSAPDVQPGRYQIDLAALAFSAVLEVPREGLRNAQLALGPPCDVVVRCIDAETGADVKCAWLNWTCALPAGVEGWPGAAATWSEDAKHWEFRAPAGALLLRTDERDYASPWETVEVHAGPNEFVLRLEKLCTLKVIFRDGDAVIPWSGPAPPELQPAEGQEDYVSWSTSESAVTLFEKQPGLHRLKVPTLPGYQPIPDELVRLERGVVTEHVIELRRLQ